MKYVAQILTTFCLAATAAFAQLPTGVIKHVVIVIQENRTPDNLFGGDIAGLPNANLATSGKCHNTNIPLATWPLDACFSPHHDHQTSWVSLWDSGSFDGACDIPIQNGTCVPPTQPPHPNYTYVPNTKYDGVHGLLDPYYQIAQTYGFANYMFQTNQGPSFPAHQFLFSGTSAPDYYEDPYGGIPGCGEAYPCWEWFAAENPAIGSPVGCTSITNPATDIDPLGHEADSYQNGYPCYDHNTLATLLDPVGISWRYYAPAVAYGYWTAPDAISGICNPVVNGKCTGSEWNSHVVIGNQGNYVGDYAPILTDIQGCNLPAVSWVVPDGTWSDHPGNTTQQASDGGPSWVSAIVDAIGGANNCEGNGYWGNTVILITWDDWGGWLDHVSPASSQGGPGGMGYSNGTGAYYVYGPRVPLLVVSAYAKQGYASGPKSGPRCGQLGVNYCHDFGSILGFVEWVFGLGYISPQYAYADYLAPDGPNSGCGPSCIPLSDFFTSTKSSFTAITPGKYQPTCFHDPNQQGCWPQFTPQDPDDDANEN